MKIHHYKITDALNWSSQKIIKASDLKVILSANEYLASIKQKCKELEEETEHKVQEATTKAYNEAVAKCHLESEKLHEELNLKLEKTLGDLSQDIYKIVYKVLANFGFEKIDVANLKNIIKYVIDDYTDIQNNIKIHARATTIEHLKTIFGEQVSYLEDANLLENECIYETNLFIYRINIDSALEKVKHILLKEHNEVT